MSGTYHLLGHGTTGRSVLQRLDHAGIWFLIIGTFTPVHVILFSGIWRWGILFLVWSTGITGLVLEVVFFTDFPEYLSLTFYLLLGWVGLLSGWGYKRYHGDRNIVWLIYGGLLYSIGAVLDFSRWPNVFPGVVAAHELFHLFVLGGIFCHWRFMESIAGMGLTARLTIMVKRRIKGPSFATATSEHIRFAFSSRDEFLKKFHQHVNRVYRDYRCPSAVRIQYVDEEFLDPSGLAPQATLADHFFNPRTGADVDRGLDSPATKADSGHNPANAASGQSAG